MSNERLGDQLGPSIEWVCDLFLARWHRVARDIEAFVEQGVPYRRVDTACGLVICEEDPTETFDNYFRVAATPEQLPRAIALDAIPTRVSATVCGQCR